MQKILLFITTFILLTQVSFAIEVKTEEMPLSAIEKQNRHIVRLAAEELNKTLPQTIDNYTKLLKIEAEGTTLLYTYEINTGAKSDEAVKKEDHSRMKKAVTTGICRTSKRFLDAKINISYLYISAKSKAKLFRFDVTKSDCFMVR